jgi:hypothetical protein
MKALVISFAMIVMIAINSFAGGTNKKTENSSESVITGTSISGVVVDEKTGEALTGVEVKLNGKNLKTYTDFDGKFVFNRVKPGDYSVEAQIISYQPLIRNISVKSDEVHALNLKMDSVGDE